ncbi:hypothetical protein PLICRDRAFT_43302 [Plicaturopsis crispa FD-325 SS-3]|nr:hypothetical protein PLICRDRAFT_43302 [Plicaturopsis crispa FD-325 SS-3]
MYDSDDARPTKRARSTDHEDNLTPTSAFHDTISLPRATTASNGDLPKKNRKKALSCAECRRLKLKCDRVFPCHSCVKRGCGSICPGGSLTSGKGNRFILANTEELHAKIIQMSCRIKELEEALATLQSSLTSEMHPLLAQDLLSIKTSLSLGIPHEGPSNLHTNASYSQVSEQARNVPSHDLASTSAQIERMEQSYPRNIRHFKGVPDDILALSQAFPVAWSVNLETRQRIRDLLPTYERAEYLCEQARKNALWQYNLDPSETFLPNTIRSVYTTPLKNLSPRRLALMLMVLSIGSKVDLNQAPDSPYPEMYFILARAALCELPVLTMPNIDMLHALFYMAWYLLIFSQESSALSYAWGIMGIASKLAQSLSLHRDPFRSKMIPEEIESRRMLFWELINLDARLALCMGRPPSFSLKHVDCRLPSYSLWQTAPSPQDPHPVPYHEYKHGFQVHCLSPIIEIGVAPTYRDIINLDRTVRDYRVPPSLDLFKGLYKERYRVMQQAIAATGREIALLQLHRPHFTQALSGPEPFSLHHQYAPSVVATFHSARQLISVVETIYNYEPQLSARFLMLWFNALSGAVALCIIVSRAPFAPQSPFALQELERVCRLFSIIADYSPNTRKALPLLAKMTETSRRHYIKWLAEQGSSRQSAHANGGHINSNTSSGDIPDRPDPFEDVHPSLIQCLEETTVETTAFPIREPSHHVSAAALSTSFSSSPHSSVEISHTLSQDMLKWYSMGWGNNFSSLAAGQNLSDEDLSGSRVPNHETFNVEFGALSGYLTDQSWLSWF